MTDRATFHRQALHAAASVALAFSAGCAGGKAPPAAPPAPAADATPGTAPAAPADVQDADPESRVARISAVRAPFQDVCGPDGDMSECCNVLRPACEQAFADDPDPYAVDECLWGPLSDGSHGCTPWGPPVPPAMA